MWPWKKEPRIWQSKRNPELWWGRDKNGVRHGPFPTEVDAKYYTKLAEEEK